MTYAENQQLSVPLGGIALRIARNLSRLPLSHALVRINGREASLVSKQSGHCKVQVQPLRLKSASTCGARARGIAPNSSTSVCRREREQVSQPRAPGSVPLPVVVQYGSPLEFRLVNTGQEQTTRLIFIGRDVRGVLTQPQGTPRPRPSRPDGRGSSVSDLFFDRCQPAPQ
jgi:hypothetical protein